MFKKVFFHFDTSRLTPCVVVVSRSLVAASCGLLRPWPLMSIHPNTRAGKGEGCGKQGEAECWCVFRASDSDYF